MRLDRFLSAWAIGAGLLCICLSFAMLCGPWYGPLAEAAGNRFTANTKTVKGDEIVISDYIIDDLSTATTLIVPANARVAMIQAQLGNVRYRWGTAPDATTGGIIFAGDYLETASSIDTIQLIQESSADAYVAFKY